LARWLGTSALSLLRKLLRNACNHAGIPGLRVPMRRMAMPVEITEAAAWLCSDGASSITGHALPLDGGSAELL